MKILLPQKHTPLENRTTRLREELALSTEGAANYFRNRIQPFYGSQKMRRCKYGRSSTTGKCKSKSSRRRGLRGLSRLGRRCRTAKGRFKRC